MEFSKLIFISIWIMTLCITIIAIVLMFITCDLTPMAYLIPAVFAELSVGTAFYYNKAKAENKIKIMKQNKMKIGKDDF